MICRRSGPPGFINCWTSVAPAFQCWSCCWVLLLFHLSIESWFELPYDKTNNVAVRPAKTQISLGIHPVWSESSLSAWRKLPSLATHWAHSEDSDQTGHTLTLLVFSWGGSFICLLLWCIDELEVLHADRTICMFMNHSRPQGECCDRVKPV